MISPGRNWIWRCVGFCGGRKTGEPRENPWSKDEKQQQTRNSHIGPGRKRTQAKLVEGERFHHCANPCSPELKQVLSPIIPRNPGEMDCYQTIEELWREQLYPFFRHIFIVLGALYQYWHGLPKNQFWFTILTKEVEDSDNISNSQNTSPLDSRVQFYSHTRDIAKNRKTILKLIMRM